MKRLHLVIIGKVQGVCFRDFVKRRAIELSIKGWVKNLDDKVEIVAEGNDTRLDEFLELCKKGPDKALVEFVQMENEEYVGEFNKFEVKY